MPEGKKYLVEYTLAYDHTVRVGVTAFNALDAQRKAEFAFDDGTIWSNTSSMPLFFDDFIEQEDKFLVFKATEVSEWPEADISVASQQELMNVKQERDSQKTVLTATQVALTQSVQYADTLESVLRRLTEKVDRLNAVQNIVGPASSTDWSDLGQLAIEARSILNA